MFIVKPMKNLIFLKNGKIIILVENRKFSRSRMTNWIVRPEKFQFSEKGKIVISIIKLKFRLKIRNLFSRSRMTKRIALLESSREI